MGSSVANTVTKYSLHNVKMAVVSYYAIVFFYSVLATLMFTTGPSLFSPPFDGSFIC